MKIGLFFGSFNPVHVGHMIIASYMVDHTDQDQVWLVLSPQNPFKKKSTLAPDYDRYHLLCLAVDDHLKIKPSNVEFSLPVPSYTIDTLTYLKEKHPGHRFSLIMGGDNLTTFHKWKNYEKILEDHDIYVYRRGDKTNQRFDNHPRINFCEAPLLHISSSYVRKIIRENKSAQYLVPDSVFQELEKSQLYKKS